MVLNVPLLSLDEHKCHVLSTWIAAWCLHASIIHMVLVASFSAVFPTVTLQQNYKWNKNKQTEVIITENGSENFQLKPKQSYLSYAVHSNEENYDIQVEACKIWHLMQ
jgi:hypothetical protein